MTATLPDWAQWLQLGLTSFLIGIILVWFVRGDR